MYSCVCVCVCVCDVCFKGPSRQCAEWHVYMSIELVLTEKSLSCLAWKRCPL